MANYAHLGNNIYVGITTDTKPTPANTANGAICIEWATNYATFIIYINNQTTWLPQTAFAETYTNKTMSGASNTFSNIPDAALPTTLAGHTLTTATLTTPIVNGIKGGDVAITNSDSPYTALATTRIIRADATSGAITVNLPTAVGIAGYEYDIFRTDILASTNIITIDANSTETIDSNLTYRLYPGEWVNLKSDGANWQVLGRTTPTLGGYYIPKNSTNNRRIIGGIGNQAAAALATSTTAPALNTLWALPVIFSKTTKCDLISFKHTTNATAGGVARCGIYRDNGNCYPGVLIFDTGSIAVDSGAGTTIDTTITAGLQVFQPGLYWLAWECGTAAPQLRVLASLYWSILGQDSAWSTGNQAYGYSVAHTFGALPDPYTGSATILTVTPSVSNPVPAVGLRPI
jgi:hypothetical protein